MVLREYKVNFRNNRPVAASPMNNLNYESPIKCSQKGHNRFVNWLVVFATDEKDAISNAKEMLHDYLMPHLGLA